MDKRHLMVFASLVALAIIIILLTWFLAFPREEVPIVDMSKVSAEAKLSSMSDQRPTLHIAIAAMISPETTRKYYEKLLRIISNSVGYRAEFIQRKTYAEVNAMIAAKMLDFAFVCAGPYVNGKENFGMEILVVPVVHGRSIYYSYIIAQQGSDVKSFDDLRGRRFAFTDPNSNTGSLVPRYMLARRGETPQSFFGETFFSNAHDNSIRAVAEGMADGAAVDSLVWEFMNNIDPSLTSRTRIIEKSPFYGIPPFVVHPDIDPDLKDRLKNAFLSIHENDEARVLLHNIQIERFVGGKDSMYESVREMKQWMEKRTKHK